MDSALSAKTFKSVLESLQLSDHEVEISLLSLELQCVVENRGK